LPKTFLNLIFLPQVVANSSQCCLVMDSSLRQKWLFKQHQLMIFLLDHFMRPPPPEFLPKLVRHSPHSLEKQLLDQWRSAIFSGRLPGGSRLASSRSLAHDLGINRNTVIAALEQLLAEGVLEARRGSGTFVSRSVILHQHPRTAPSQARWLREVTTPPTDTRPQQPLEFCVGLPSTEAFPLQAWQRAWREAAASIPAPEYSQAAGEAHFCREIALYLRRARGLLCQPQDVLVTNGAIQAIHLIAQTTLSQGTSVAFENPGYTMARVALQQHGAQIVPIAVDEDGILVTDLPCGKSAPTLVYVTPSHQFPTGGRMSLARRIALLAWAEENDALILEDDYDSEFRFDVPPLPPLASLDTSGRVAYIGTFSKVLSPTLRLGYVVATPALQKRLQIHKTIADYHSNTQSQLAMAHFLQSGALERHIAKMRRIYASKRSVLVQALQPLEPIASVVGLEAGLNIFLRFTPDVRLDAVVQGCLQRGVLVTDVERYTIATSSAIGFANQWHGLVLGYGGLSEDQIRQASAVLLEVVNAGFALARHGVLE
jgi:GntR family transcriptional regulator / MocR family aminotransferase